MSTRLKVFVLAVMVLGGLILGVAFTAPQPGTPLPDFVAAEVYGGCAGAKSINCHSGSYCGTGTYVTAGHGTTRDPIGSATCGGGTSCYNGWSSSKECAP